MGNVERPKLIEGNATELEPDTEAQDRTLHGPISAQDSAHNGDSPRARGHVDDMTRKAFESLPNSKPPKV